ncbi:hypothetical protein [Portibacter lacus]|uniref:Phosphopeptide-binding protein n=1 Tax=Portibacter lacus TaxID=1099794 RepID=A0AA37STT0_9BACT|nr:hypothetical protein [Portibacter lacus]GLR20107.1 hypothetical protein GCM10007940_47230 [Portibacter lacus]
MKTYILRLSIFIAVASFASCDNATKTADTMDAKDDVTVAEMKYTISPFSESPAFTDAAIQSMDYQNGKFNFGVTGSEYKLGNQTPDAEVKMCANSSKGQHIHLIVDNEPYAAKYTADFDYEIADGEHYLLAFLSRSYHESIKTDQANVAQKIEVKNNSIVAGEDIKEPMLFYSRPKGTYVGQKDTEKIMLDFYLANTTLAANGNKVKAEINGEEHMFDKWQPYFIEGLPMGDNTITLTLVDKDGKTVDTPLNPVTRTFKLEKDPAPAD